ncbi:MAG: YdcH family protein [Cardiobacteriaceae bacterium]|nr:YdcH family protein [Cardiobacteriaceae bacterium]
MLHEHRELIAELRQQDRHFARLFDAHNALDEEINNLEQNPVTAVSAHSEIEQKKVQKLALKDEIYQYILNVEKERKG